ncbi:MAG: hypothetical protein ABL907_06360 [Hyphomicrobium sp.]
MYLAEMSGRTGIARHLDVFFPARQHNEKQYRSQFTKMLEWWRMASSCAGGMQLCMEPHETGPIRWPIGVDQERGESFVLSLSSVWLRFHVVLKLRFFLQSLSREPLFLRGGVHAMASMQ